MGVIPSEDPTALQKDVLQELVQPPRVREAPEVLCSCLVTILLSAYVMVHLNVPRSDRARWRNVLHELKWIVVGAIAPELMLWQAIGQWRNAYLLLSKLRAEYARSASGQSMPSKDISLGSVSFEKHVNQQFRLASTTARMGTVSTVDGFDLTDAFFIMMGGLQLDVSEFTDRTEPARLTQEGVKWLAEHDLFISIPKDQIQDRRRSDRLMKLLLCSQGLWMFVQCGARVTHGHPLAFLELASLVHLLFAFMCCCVWLKKPRNVTKPMTVSNLDKGHIALLVSSGDAEEVFEVDCDCHTHAGHPASLSLTARELFMAELNSRNESDQKLRPLYGDATFGGRPTQHKTKNNALAVYRKFLKSTGTERVPLAVIKDDILTVSLSNVCSIPRTGCTLRSGLPSKLLHRHKTAVSCVVPSKRLLDPILRQALGSHAPDMVINIDSFFADLLCYGSGPTVVYHALYLLAWPLTSRAGEDDGTIRFYTLGASLWPFGFGSCMLLAMLMFALGLLYDPAAESSPPKDLVSGAIFFTDIVAMSIAGAMIMAGCYVWLICKVIFVSLCSTAFSVPPIEALVIIPWSEYIPHL